MLEEGRLNICPSDNWQAKNGLVGGNTMSASAFPAASMYWILRHRWSRGSTIHESFAALLRCPTSAQLCTTRHALQRNILQTSSRPPSAASAGSASSTEPHLAKVARRHLLRMSWQRCPASCNARCRVQLPSDSSKHHHSSQVGIGWPLRSLQTLALHWPHDFGSSPYTYASPDQIANLHPPNMQESPTASSVHPSFL